MQVPIWYAAGLIRLHRDGPEKFCDASGFYWRHDGRIFLVTNWHNVTGWDPIRNKALDEKTGFVPTHVDLSFLHPAEERGPDVVRRKSYKKPLYTADGAPAWLEHPTHGRAVDVIALEVCPEDPIILTPSVNNHSELTDFEPGLGDDVFVMGFPHGLSGADGLAIWKRGSIATHPNCTIDGLPKLLIDTATRKGMSGSPVIARRSGLIRPRGVTSDRPLADSDIIGTAETFLGIYSGRMGDDEMGVQLGIVWKAEVVEEIIKGQARGKSPFEA